MMSQMARLNLSAVVKLINDKHMKPWMELLKKNEISLNSPCTPYLDIELLRYNHVCVNGERIESLGFEYKHPIVTTEALRGVVEEAIAQKVFPPGVLVGSGGKGGGQ